MTSENIQNLATDIIIHVMHILELYIKGHITGVNSCQWTQHVVADIRFICNSLIFSIFPISGNKKYQK